MIPALKGRAMKSFYSVIIGQIFFKAYIATSFPSEPDPVLVIDVWDLWFLGIGLKPNHRIVCI